MKAVGLYRYLPIDHAEALVDVEIPKPEASGRDLLVKVEAIAVNPVDTKVRAPKDTVEKTPRAVLPLSMDRPPLVAGARSCVPATVRPSTACRFCAASVVRITTA